MPKAVQPASFEDFLKSPSRLAERAASAAKAPDGENPSATQAEPRPLHSSTRAKAPSEKRKVGLTIDADVIDAIDDYIYHERKQGRRLKKNDVYEAALRQFLGLEDGDAQ